MRAKQTRHDRFWLLAGCEPPHLLVAEPSSTASLPGLWMGCIMPARHPVCPSKPSINLLTLARLLLTSSSVLLGRKCTISSLQGMHIMLFQECCGMCWSPL